MVFLLPLVERADMVFVLLLKLLAIKLEEATQEAGADGVII